MKVWIRAMPIIWSWNFLAEELLKNTLPLRSSWVKSKGVAFWGKSYQLWNISRSLISTKTTWPRAASSLMITSISKSQAPVLRARKNQNLTQFSNVACFCAKCSAENYRAKKSKSSLIRKMRTSSPISYLRQWKIWSVSFWRKRPKLKTA